jgi:hypothetical protein
MNKLRQVTAELRRLSTVDAEVWIIVHAEQISASTEIRGRLVGPRCPNISTIEVAYQLRAIPRHPAQIPPLSRCVNIPDPSLWEPERPFLYHAVIELWQDGSLCDTAEFDYGLRMPDPPATSPRDNS